MKKFIFSLILLLIVGGTVFYFGYIPFRLQDGSYGVVFTKTNGWKHPVLAPGEFHWLWQGLFPTNLQLFQVQLTEQNIDVSLDGTLPSGEVYRTYADTSEDFSYSVHGSFSYRLDPRLLPEIFSEKGVSGDFDTASGAQIMASVYDGINSRVRTLFRDTASALIEQGDFGLTPQEFESRLTDALRENIQEIENFNLLIQNYRFPDITLYNAARDNYLLFLKRSHEINLASLEKASGAKAQEMSRIEILKQYGELLQEYPVLMDYFSRKNGTEPLIPLPEESP